MALPKVSIGLATYNRASLVSKCINSIMSQDYQGLIEIIAIDDGSADNTLQVLQNVRSRAKRIFFLLERPHRGIAPCYNDFLSLSSGDFRGVIDSDDWYAPQFIRTCVQELMNNPDVGLVYTDNLYVDPKGKLIRVCPALDWDLQVLLRTRNLRGDCWLARWKGMLEHAHYDERFELEVDYDLYLQLVPYMKFKRISQPLHSVLEHGMRTTRNREKSAFFFAALLAKYGYDIQYAYKRAKEFGRLNEWTPLIQAGERFGREIRNAI